MLTPMQPLEDHVSAELVLLQLESKAFKHRNSLLSSKRTYMRPLKKRASRNALLSLVLNGWRGKMLPNRFKAAELTRTPWSYLKYYKT